MTQAWGAVPYAQATDPALTSPVVPGQLWVDTTNEPPTTKMRNKTNTGWDAVGGGGTTPTLAQVLAQGNDPGGHQITAASATNSHGATESIAAGGASKGGAVTLTAGAAVAGGASGGDVNITAGDGAVAAPGGTVFILGGPGDGDNNNGAEIDVIGGPDNTGAGASIVLKPASPSPSSAAAGGDVSVSLPAGDGAGRHGQFIFHNLPTADPHVAGALFTSGAPGVGTPKALMVSGG